MNGYLFPSRVKDFLFAKARLTCLKEYKVHTRNSKRALKLINSKLQGGLWYLVNNQVSLPAGLSEMTVSVKQTFVKGTIQTKACFPVYLLLWSYLCPCSKYSPRKWSR